MAHCLVFLAVASLAVLSPGPGVVIPLRHVMVALALFALLPGAPVRAQSTANPLRPPAKAAPQAPAPQAPAAQAPAVAAPAAPQAKPGRSEAQLANDRRMKACGAEWRANKDKLKAEGKTWQTYNVECRARMKAAGQ